MTPLSWHQRPPRYPRRQHWRVGTAIGRQSPVPQNKTFAAVRTSGFAPGYLRSSPGCTADRSVAQWALADRVRAVGFHSIVGSDGRSGLRPLCLRYTTSPTLRAPPLRWQQSGRSANRRSTVAQADNVHRSGRAKHSTREAYRWRGGRMDDDGKVLAKRWPRTGISTHSNFPADRIMSTLERMHRAGRQRDR